MRRGFYLRRVSVSPSKCCFGVVSRRDTSGAKCCFGVGETRRGHSAWVEVFRDANRPTGGHLNRRVTGHVLAQSASGNNISSGAAKSPGILLAQHVNGEVCKSRLDE